MKKQLLLMVMLCASSIYFAQTDRLWSTGTKDKSAEIFQNKSKIINPQIYHLDITGLKNELTRAPRQLEAGGKSGVIISFPGTNGKMESFRVSEHSNFDPQLAAKYPDIKSYIGESVDSGATVYFSISPLGLFSMEIGSDRSAVFIEPYTKDLSAYVVYKRSDKKDDLNAFECGVVDVAQKSISAASDPLARPNADDGKLRTFRLALSCSGEYANNFGGTKAGALAAMNNTMTRVNAIFEKEISTRMVLIPNNDVLIYTDSSTDPYTSASQAWSYQLTALLANHIGEDNYDIGHLFAGIAAGGYAGCIGCVCVPTSKGTAFTSPVYANDVPSGENFDLTVAHEMGHQLGANHTYSVINEGTGTNMEPGSGSTIMGYAGITSQDVQQHADAFFHAISIQQITNNIKNKTCPVVTNTGNSIPTANAGADYTIPKGTPFMLTGTGADANGDALTYIWEELDNASSSQIGANSAASATKASGPAFRSWTPTTSPVRYFPRMASVLTGATTTSGLEITVEALSDVARTYNFRFTVRDNRAGGSGNNSDDAVITVNGTAGPFSISSQNSAVTYPGGSSQTITWNVAGTTSNGINAANVDILWSKDAGVTWTTLLAATPNDGSQAVTIPDAPTTTGRIMVKGSNHIFFDVNNAAITVTEAANVPSPPVLSASGTTSTSTSLSWSGATSSIGIAGYYVYQGSTQIGFTASSSYTVTGLTPSTTYSFSVKAKDAAGNISPSSNVISVTTNIASPDTVAPTAPILSSSGKTSTTIQLSWSGATDNVAVTGYDIYYGSLLIGSTPVTACNVVGLAPSTTYSFSIKAKDAAGNISPSSNVVSVTTNTVSSDTVAPTAPILSSSGKTSTTIQLSWSGATDNVAVTGYDIYYGSSLIGSTPVTACNVVGLTPSTTYSFSVKAKDAAGNISPSSNVVSVTTNIVSSTAGKTGSANHMAIETNTPDTATSLELYPNPVSDILHISGMTDEEYSIFDMSGKLIRSGKLEKGSLQVGTLINGTYLIKIGKASTRFIKS